MRKLWLTYSSQTTAILGALLVGWRWTGTELHGNGQAFDLMCFPTITGQLLPPAPSPRGQHWHELQQHTPATARGGSAERLPSATGIYALPSPIAIHLPICNLSLLPTPRCYGS